MQPIVHQETIVLQYSLKVGLSDIVNEVEKLHQPSVCDLNFNMIFYLGKFLATITGIDAATSTHACIWCKCLAIEWHDSTQIWSI